VTARKKNRWMRLLTVVYLVAIGVMYAGIAAAVFGWKPSAWLMLSGAAGFGAIHLAGGIVEYRRVMRRPWPRVAPLPDDDDW
jgi:hypothetical protein